MKADTYLKTHARAAQMRDYGARGMALGGQRISIYAVALVAQAFYLSIVFSAVSTILILVAEMFDVRTFQQARALRNNDPAALRKVSTHMHIGALYGALVISFVALAIALSSSGTTLMMPMLLLIAAAVFTAMNTHQVASLLVLRLGIYSAAFASIPVLELIMAGPVISLDMWANVIASLLVVYFIADCARIGLHHYRSNTRQLAQMLREKNRAKAALDTKTKFLSTVSREVRAPLASVREALDTVLADRPPPAPDQYQTSLSLAQRNVARLSNLVDELLDLQKFEVGAIEFDFCDVQLAGLISEAVADNRAYAQSLDVTLKMLPVDTDIFVRADPMRLEQVITNLLTNAAKFSNAESVVTLGATADAGRVRITVHDTGRGIDPASRTEIFNSFSHLDNMDTRNTSGTGLGLNISKRIIKAHGGVIDFAPNPDRGTTFFLELARVTPQAAQTAARQPAPRSKTRPN